VRTGKLLFLCGLLATNYLYDEHGELTQVTNPDGTTTQTEYDAAGHQTAQIDEEGHKTTFTYDASSASPRPWARGRWPSSLFTSISRRCEQARPHAQKRDTASTRRRTAMTPHTCPHVEQIRPVTPQSQGCEQCLATGDRWVHLRLCLTCGHIGCC